MTSGTDGRVNAELLHGELAFLLGRAGIPVLHIKGPSVAAWLYPRGGREWGDVDVLVPRRRVDDALAVLAAHGFDEQHPGVNHRTTTDHAVTVQREPTSPAAGEVDVHHRFPGITLRPDDAFDLLWARRVPAELAHTTAQLPDLAARAVLLALNTARSPGSPKAREDLRRLVVDPDLDWTEVVELGHRLGALPAVRAGLELDPGGHRVVASTALSGVAVSPEWALRTTASTTTALRLDSLRRAPLRSVPRLVARWLLPHPAVIRMRDPRARGGAGALVMAYLRRLGDGVRAVPASVRQLRSAAR